jgi:hypothetical protein
MTAGQVFSIKKGERRGRRIRKIRENQSALSDEVWDRIPAVTGSSWRLDPTYLLESSSAGE